MARSMCGPRDAIRHGEPVLSYARWVMVNKRDEDSPAPDAARAGADPPSIRRSSARRCRSSISKFMTMRSPDRSAAGGLHSWRQDRPCRRPDHRGGRAPARYPPVPEYCARAFQSAHRGKARFSAGLIYGGHVISMARSLSFNGLANAFHLAGPEWRAPCRALLRRRHHLCLERDHRQSRASRAERHGRVATRTFAVKDRSCADFPGAGPTATYEDGVVLDLDCWVALPR